MSLLEPNVWAWAGFRVSLAACLAFAIRAYLRYRA